MRELNGPIVVLLAGLSLWPLLAIWVFAGPVYVLALAALVEVACRLRPR